MKILIQLSKQGTEGAIRTWDIATRVDKHTAQKVINTDFSMYVEGGGKVILLGEIVPLV